MGDKRLVKDFLRISKAHEGAVSVRGTPLPEGDLPCDALEIVEFEYVLPEADGKFRDIRSHRTAAAHVAVKAKTRDDYEIRLDKTPAGRCWLCFNKGTMFISTDRPADRPLFEVMGEDPQDCEIYDVKDGLVYTGLIA